MEWSDKSGRGMRRERHMYAYSARGIAHEMESSQSPHVHVHTACTYSTYFIPTYSSCLYKSRALYIPAHSSPIIS